MKYQVFSPFIFSVCHRSVLWDMWRLFLQCDHQHHQHPCGGRCHGGHGLQETWAQEVQPSHHWQHRLLRHRWRQTHKLISVYSLICCDVSDKQTDISTRKLTIYDSPTHTLFLDKIPVAVNISQKAAVNQTKNVYFRGEDVVFKVQLHDPSGYLKTASSIDYIWDFRDGNQLVTHRDVTTHTYSSLGNMSVKLVVEAAFPIECPPTVATPTQKTSTPSHPTGTGQRYILVPVVVVLLTEAQI